MHHAALVGEVHGPGQDLDELGGGKRRLGFAGELACQAAAIDIFQREKGPAVDFADLVNLHDIGMLQTGRRLGLELEAAQIVVAGMGAAQHHLESHDAVEPSLPGLVDDAHAAPAQDAEDFVVADHLLDGFARRRRGVAQRLAEGGVRRSGRAFLPVPPGGQRHGRRLVRLGSGSGSEMALDLGGKVRKTAQVFFQGQRFSPALAQADLGFHEPPGALPIGLERRMRMQIRFGKNAIALLPRFCISSISGGNNDVLPWSMVCSGGRTYVSAGPALPAVSPAVLPAGRTRVAPGEFWAEGGCVGGAARVWSSGSIAGCLRSSSAGRVWAMESTALPPGPAPGGVGLARRRRRGRGPGLRHGIDVRGGVPARGHARFAHRIDVAARGLGRACQGLVGEIVGHRRRLGSGLRWVGAGFVHGGSPCATGRVDLRRRLPYYDNPLEETPARTGEFRKAFLKRL